MIFQSLKTQLSFQVIFQQQLQCAFADNLMQLGLTIGLGETRYFHLGSPSIWQFIQDRLILDFEWVRVWHMIKFCWTGGIFSGIYRIRSNCWLITAPYPETFRIFCFWAAIDLVAPIPFHTSPEKSIFISLEIFKTPSHWCFWTVCHTLNCFGCAPNTVSTDTLPLFWLHFFRS